MITGILKNKVDKLWEEFWTGGITNPLTVIEQISYLIFARNLHIRECMNEKLLRRNPKADVKLLFSGEDDPRRWSNLRNVSDANRLLKIVRDDVFRHFREEVGRIDESGDKKSKQSGKKESLYREIMKDAQLMIQRPELLYRAIDQIETMMSSLSHVDMKGDVFEYILSKLTTAGINGQFRTPRHLIRKMVEMIDPKPDDTVGDPACGTGGFLVAAFEFIREQGTSPEGVLIEQDENGKRIDKIYSGDRLTKIEWDHIHYRMFHGFDFDMTMLRLSTMNLVLHGLENPNIHYCDTLSNAMPDRFPDLASNAFSVILANPPFKGSLDAEAVHKSLTTKVDTKKTELLFLVQMLRMLKIGGRCGVVVPDGVLFGSSTAHKDLRRLLVNENQLEAVISLPSGVFKPYAGVSTAVLIFTKAGQTENVFFYDVQADGFSLDDKRQKVAEDDLPDMLLIFSKISDRVAILCV